MLLTRKKIQNRFKIYIKIYRQDIKKTKYILQNKKSKKIKF